MTNGPGSPGWERRYLETRAACEDRKLTGRLRPPPAPWYRTRLRYVVYAAALALGTFLAAGIALYLTGALR